MSFEKYYDDQESRIESGIEKKIENIISDVEELVKDGFVKDSILKEVVITTFGIEKIYFISQYNTDDYNNKIVKKERLGNYFIYEVLNDDKKLKIRESYYTAVAHYDSQKFRSIFNKELENKDLGDSNYQEMVDSILVPLKDKFDEKWNERYFYKTDVLLHELTHIEWIKKTRRLKDGKKELFDNFIKNRDRFIEDIKKTKIFQKIGKRNELIDVLKSDNGWYGALSEMYAMLTDREGLKKYNKILWEENKEMVEECIKSDSCLSGKHVLGALLVYMLEELYENYNERKKYIDLLFFGDTK